MQKNNEVNSREERIILKLKSDQDNFHVETLLADNEQEKFKMLNIKNPDIKNFSIVMEWIIKLIYKIKDKNLKLIIDLDPYELPTPDSVKPVHRELLENFHKVLQKEINEIYHKRNIIRNINY